jgi:hypothetical protein
MGPGALSIGRTLSVTSDLGSGSEDAAEGVLPADVLDQVIPPTCKVPEKNNHHVGQCQLLSCHFTSLNVFGILGGVDRNILSYAMRLVVHSSVPILVPNAFWAIMLR